MFTNFSEKFFSIRIRGKTLNEQGVKSFYMFLKYLK